MKAVKQGADILQGKKMIPDELWINGRAYLIEDCGTHPLGDVVLGCMKYPDGIILLNQDIDLEGQLKTLWHEAYHVFQQDILGKTDEGEANLVSTFIHNFLTHNREIADCYSTTEEPEAFDDDERAIETDENGD